MMGARAGRAIDRIWRGRAGLAATLGIGLLAIVAAVPAAAQEDHSTLTPESYRRNCLMCHSRAAPEGVSPEILAGLHPVAGLKPRDAMPTLTCWRRCERCWPKKPASATR